MLATNDTCIRRVTMVRLATRRHACEEWDRDDICPNIVKRVQVLCHESRTCKALMCGGGEFEIIDEKSSFAVSLNQHTCKCNLWQITGIPCKHGMRAILSIGMDPIKFVDNWYTVKLYKLTYGSNINLVPDVDQWPEIDLPPLQPPQMKRVAGRPSRNRKRGSEEERKGKRSKTIQRGNCKEFGHNTLTCKGGKNSKAAEGYTRKQKQRKK